MISLYILKFLSILPLKFLYFLSRILSFLAIKVINYRVKVVEKNLSLTRRFFKSHDLSNIKEVFYKYFVLIKIVYNKKNYKMIKLK